MAGPISPAPVKGAGRKELPAYISNGIIGLRIRETALSAGLALINGYTGEHPVRGIEAAATAPYPVAGDIQLAGVWISDAPSQVTALEQSYDFSTGELTRRFRFQSGSNTDET
jgi:protein-glucosylgalactosylhydroxylysine glucosidase